MGNVKSVYIEHDGDKNSECAYGGCLGGRNTNEDRHILMPVFQNKRNRQLSLYVICDGHGGVGAADFVCKELPSRLSLLDDVTNVNSLEKMIVELDEDLLKDPIIRKSGCTCCIAIVEFFPKNKRSASNKPFAITWINIGDSCAFILNENKTILNHTIIHDFKDVESDEYKRIIKDGGFVTKDYRVGGGPNLSRSFGDYDEITKGKRKGMSVRPDINPNIEIDRTCLLLMFCDGLYGNESPNDYVDEFIQNVKYQTLKQDKLVDDAIVIAFDQQQMVKMDNLSVLSVSFKLPGKQDELDKWFIPCEASKDDSDFYAKCIDDAKSYGFTKEKSQQMFKDATFDIISNPKPIRKYYRIKTMGKDINSLPASIINNALINIAWSNFLSIK